MRPFLLPFALLALVACAEPDARVTPSEPAMAGEGAVAASYSPFALEVSEGAPFRLISFKDVGMSLPEDARGFVYESLAESLATSLRRRADGPLASQVVHDPTLLDPSAHLACEGGHIYVDVWSAGEGYGYSLWSGCGAEDRFAHREVASQQPVSEDAVAALLPLAEDMAAQLRSAVTSGCFTRHC